MSKYVHLYRTTTAFEDAYKGTDYKEPWVSRTLETESINYNKKEKDRYLTFEIKLGGELYWKTNNASFAKTIEYRRNYGEWTELVPTTAGTHFSVSSNDIIEFRGDNTAYGNGSSYNTFSGSTCRFEVRGNIMSLIDSEDYADLDTLSANYAFQKLFDHTLVIDASRLALPATTLSFGCYYNLFHGCILLTRAPKLPATTLADYCYSGMFLNCTGLTAAPKLPATAVPRYAYSSMFSNCASLTTVPELPAKTMTDGCYANMFQGCSGLTATTELKATTLALQCYQYMFADCRSLTQAPELPVTSLVDECYQYMFAGCTSLTTAPELPATTLGARCYQYMFSGCTNLTTAPTILPATTLANYCYESMFRRCTSLTTAPELPATTLVTSCYREMFEECTNLNHIKCLATTAGSSAPLYFWVYRVAANGTFIKSPDATFWETGNSGIPDGWTVTDAS